MSGKNFSPDQPQTKNFAVLKALVISLFDNYSGGMAGVLSWIISYPLDVIKSKIQAERLDKRSYKGLLGTGLQK